MTKQKEHDPIPPFRPDGYLPEGVYLSSGGEAVFRFGASGHRRRRLAVQLLLWIDRGRVVGAHRLLVDGSFVTAKPEPDDVDAVMLLPADFHRRVVAGDESAVELDEMLRTRQPRELFAAEDEDDWLAWVEFFTRTREADGRRKGIVEIRL